MEFLYIIGVFTSFLILIKIIHFVFALLLPHYGRIIGLDAKYAKNGEFVVIIGATGTIGREYVYKFASMGYNLILISKQYDKLEELEKSIREEYRTIQHMIKITADFTKLECYDKIHKRLSILGPIVALVNCTGYCQSPSKYWQYPKNSNYELILVNVLAPVLIMGMLIPRFIAQKQGMIINLGSQSGDFRFTNYSTFSASKSFIHTLTEIISIECRMKNIHIQTIKPCLIETSKHNIRSNFLNISAKQMVYYSLRLLGIQTNTYGYWKHIIIGYLLNMCVFFIGHRFTTFISQYFISSFVRISEEKTISNDSKINTIDSVSSTDSNDVNHKNVSTIKQMIKKQFTPMNYFIHHPRCAPTPPQSIFFKESPKELSFKLNSKFIKSSLQKDSEIQRNIIHSKNSSKKTSQMDKIALMKNSIMNIKELKSVDGRTKSRLKSIKKSFV